MIDIPDVEISWQILNPSVNCKAKRSLNADYLNILKLYFMITIS
jgi:hypothetical protein